MMLNSAVVRGLLMDLSPLRGREFPYLVDINAMFFGMPQALFPAVAARYGGATVLGFLLAVAGAMDANSGLFRSVIWNETIPDRLRGRLAGVEMISYTSGPTLGNFEAGASVVGVRASVVSGGVICVIGTGVILALLPAFWRYDARERVAA